MAFPIILSRWLHIISACLVIGGVFFMRFIFARGLGDLEPEASQRLLLRTRRVFKMVVHTAILLLLVTGIYNSYLAWDNYRLNEALLHSLWGTHLLLAALGLGVLVYVLAGAEPRRSHRALMAVAFLILLMVVAAASTLKWARERTVAEHQSHISTPEKQ
jgi:uncharacterized membrane protein